MKDLGGKVDMACTPLSLEWICKFDKFWGQSVNIKVYKLNLDAKKNFLVN